MFLFVHFALCVREGCDLPRCFLQDREIHHLLYLQPMDEAYNKGLSESVLDTKTVSSMLIWVVSINALEKDDFHHAPVVER